MNNLIAKSFLGFAFLMTCLALALFLSAGTLVFWQAWVVLANWAFCIVLITIYLIRFDRRLLESRVQAGPIAETQKTQKIIQSLASLSFIGIFVVAGLDHRFGWSSVPLIVTLISNLLIALGFYIVFLVFRENTFTSAVIEVTEDQKVIDTGPYSVVRHPMYSGAGLLVLCMPPALGSWVAITFSFAVIFVIILRLLDEEKLLRANLKGYEAYCQKVRYRLIPLVW